MNSMLKTTNNDNHSYKQPLQYEFLQQSFVVFTCTELFKKLELDTREACIDRAHRIGKKTPGMVRPIIVRFTKWRHRTMIYRKRKDCVNCRITLDLTKTRMDILKEAIDLARESDHISYAFADINCSLCVKLTVRLSFLTLLMISITCRILYLFFVLALICELV